MTATIKDVAARAGVSPKTVSRVMNDEPHVRAGIRDRVKAVVAELGYRPNAHARSLSSARTYMIALLSDDASSGYATMVQRGAQGRAREHNYHLLVESVDTGIEGWIAELADYLERLHPDGAILTPPLSHDPHLLDMLETRDIPYVRVSPGDRMRHRSGSVGFDEQRAAFEMTSHLLGLGHQAVAFIEGDMAHASAHARRIGYMSAMTAAGVPIPADGMQSGDFTFRSGFLAGERLLTGAARPTAIFACNDDMALGVRVAALKLGIAVPEQLSIAGFDDAPTSTLAWPAITTIHQPAVELGRAAVDILVRPDYRTAVDAPDHIKTLDYMLLERGSTSTPRTDKT